MILSSQNTLVVDTINLFYQQVYVVFKVWMFFTIISNDLSYNINISVNNIKVNFSKNVLIAVVVES